MLLNVEDSFLEVSSLFLNVEDLFLNISSLLLNVEDSFLNVGTPTRNSASFCADFCSKKCEEISRRGADATSATIKNAEDAPLVANGDQTTRPYPLIPCDLRRIRAQQGERIGATKGAKCAEVFPTKAF